MASPHHVAFDYDEFSDWLSSKDIFIKKCIIIPVDATLEKLRALAAPTQWHVVTFEKDVATIESKKV